MEPIDLTSLYRNSIGYDSLASILDAALSSDTATTGYPPYNIEMIDKASYVITLDVAGFEKSELDISVENGVLTINSGKPKDDEHKYFHQDIANRPFECKFNLADYVEVTNADLHNGLLTVSLIREIPEAMKPKSIPITQKDDFLEHNADKHPEGKIKEAA